MSVSSSANRRPDRLNQERQVGKNFFEEVAPCTRVKEFFGRFTAGLAAKNLYETFGFVFKFEHGWQNAAITLMYSQATQSARPSALRSTSARGSRSDHAHQRPAGHRGRGSAALHLGRHRREGPNGRRARCAHWFRCLCLLWVRTPPDGIARLRRMSNHGFPWQNPDYGVTVAR